nr:hypothetical protein [Reticulibacter mediterranei]
MLRREERKLLDSVVLPSRRERWCEPGQHASAGSEHNEGLGALGQALMIATEPTEAHEQAEGALDDPSSGQGTKPRWEELAPVHLLTFGHQDPPFGDRERFDGLHPPAQVHLHPRDKLSTIMAIASHESHAREAVCEWGEQGTRSLLIGAMRPCDFHRQNVALRVN